jgi:hypothetical protein
MMKARDIKPCAICGKGVMHSGVPLFYRVKVESMGVDIAAVKRHSGLEQVFGGGQAGAVLADVMGPDPDIAKPIIEDQPAVLVCQTCALEPRPLLLLLNREGHG